MKKCFIMFLFFVLMLLIAALMENTQALVPENRGMEYVNAEFSIAAEEVNGVIEAE